MGPMHFVLSTIFPRSGVLWRLGSKQVSILLIEPYGNTLGTQSSSGYSATSYRHWGFGSLADNICFDTKGRGTHVYG